MTIFIEQNQPFSAPIKWVFALIGANKNVVFNVINTIENADLIVSNAPNSDVFLDLEFYNAIDKNDFNVKNPFYMARTRHQAESMTEGSPFELKTSLRGTKQTNSKLNPIINLADSSSANLNFEFLIFNSNKDYLAAIFYLVNCLQEYNATSLDGHGRYQFLASWQAQTGTITQNVVQQIINFFLENQPKLRHLALVSRESCVFLTHDIDGLYNAWKTEGLWAAKNFRLDKILHLLYLEAIRRPAWFNIDDILKLHSEYDLRSTFFFLTEKGRNRQGVTHADYDVNSDKIQQLFARIKAHKSEIGLHKSALNHSNFNSELNKLPLNDIKSNRYHFLKFQLPEAWQTMEKSGVDLDASLGFAEQFGFRNSYGLPFSPYNFEEKRAMKLIVTPLNIMDGTMEMYQGLPISKIAENIILFFENNRKDAILSLLWHNREFSPFRFDAYLGIYKQVLTYLYESKIRSVTASEIVATYV
jgi:hypothetical protein